VEKKTAEVNNMKKNEKILEKTPRNVGNKGETGFVLW